MPVYRDKSGRIVEEKTDLKPETSNKTSVEGTDKPSPRSGRKSYDDPTVAIGRSGKTASTESPSSQGGNRKDENKTAVFGRRKAKETDQTQAHDVPSVPNDAMDNPPVGWLIVLHGPGQGRHLALGYGQNSIGRGKEQRVCIDFGDEEISRQHAVLTYEPRGRKFYIQQGQGSNLVYLYDQPVLTPTELPPLSDISVGATVLRFVPFCGPEFDWQDLKK